MRRRAGNIIFAALLLAVGFVAYKLFGLLGAHRRRVLLIAARG